MASPPGKLTLPPPPTASEILGNTALDSGSPSSPTNLFAQGGKYVSNLARGPRGPRQSFSTVGRSTRRGSRWTTAGVDLTEDDAGPRLPTLVPGIRPAYSTPLPTLPMIVLCIAMLSELLAANLCTPFLLKMVEGFFLNKGHEKNSETEAAVGLWTGNLVSVFFITQFLTSLLWSSIADRHGRRAVLVASLAGSAVALSIFGTSQSLAEAICVRLAQGIFGGAVGVFRGSIRDITDDTNATRAYALLGFSWGFGGVMGPILGGVFESPASNFAGTFLARIVLFQNYPYLLPTILGAGILLVGAILSCFLSWDGGVRGGQRIALPVEKDEPLVAAVAAPGAASPAPSNRTAVPVPSLRPKRSVLSPGIEEGSRYPALGASVPHARRDSRASLGTAYGYGGIRSKHPTLAARAALEAARRVSAQVPLQDDEEEEPKRLGFAQKLLLANEENTFNINDLWLSAAVAQDTAVFDDDEEEEDEGDAEEVEDAVDITPSGAPRSSFARYDTIGSRASNRTFSRSRIVSNMSLARNSLLSPHGRRLSTASGAVPAIFNNTGLVEPPALLSPTAESQRDPFFPSPGGRRPAPNVGGLSAIAERSSIGHAESSADVAEKEQSTWKSLPLLMISQYGLVALVGTVHDQLFLSFLTSPYKSGGIGLTPANFSFLIALMCLFQLVYQFYLYPRLGPPLGRFSHLQMFRIGCLLYVPAYFSLPLVRLIASPDKSGGFAVMTAVTLITAMRYCGGTFAYTAVMVLINAMSPPHVVGLANGLAQSTVSCARFFGPIIGGVVWSASINGNPDGYAKPFYLVTIGCLVQWALSFFIR